MKWQCFVLSCFYLTLMYGQKEEIQQTLLEKSYDELELHFNTVKTENNLFLAEKYANAYLKKGAIAGNAIKQADGYYFLSSINNSPASELYADSIISLTEGIKDIIYPARGFLVKAISLQRMGKYKEAIDELLEANTHAKANNNVPQQMEVKYRIGILKTDLEAYEDAIIIFKEYLHLAEKQYKKDKSNINDYIKALLALGDVYNRNGNYDLATMVNKKGIEASLKNNRPEAIYFTMSNGLTAYYEKKYSVSQDSLQKAIRVLQQTFDFDAGNLAICYLFMGKSYDRQKNTDTAVLYYKKVDSIVAETSNIFPDIKEAYEALIRYYEKKNDTENELMYRRRLADVNSILYDDYKYLNKKIDDEYDDPELKGIINILNNYVVILLIIVLLIGGFAFYYYKKQLVYRKRFEALLKEKKIEKRQLPDKATSDTFKNLNISEVVLNDLKERLNLFVIKEQFCSNDISLNNLAEEWGTNPRYLSAIINYYEKKNFRDYIRDLRIDHAIERLKNDPYFRKYSVEAIAEDVGYNNTQSFSRAFYKRTGIHPSYFIRELEKEVFRKQNTQGKYSY